MFCSLASVNPVSSGLEYLEDFYPVAEYVVAPQIPDLFLRKLGILSLT